MDIRLFIRLALGLTAGTLAACASAGQNLEPAPRADKVATRVNAAEETDGDVRVIVQAVQWPGDARITEEVTPLRVSIENRGDHVLYLTYDEFALQAGDQRYAALPPFQTDGEVESDDVIATTHWEYDSFAAAPYYGAYYPGMTLWETHPWPPPARDRLYYTEWSDTEDLPTPEMLAWALPEGVIEPGGMVSGYLYFERVDDDESDVQFRARLRDVNSELEVVNVSIPFMVTQD